MSTNSNFRKRCVRTVTAAVALGAAAAIVAPATASAQPAPGSSETGVPEVDGFVGSAQGSADGASGSATGSVERLPGAVGILLGNTGSAMEMIGGLESGSPTKFIGGMVNGVLTGVNAFDTTGSLAATQPCNADTIAGGPGVTNTKHAIGRPGPTTFVLRHETFSIPDRIEVFYEGRLIHDTGYIGDDINEGWGTPTVAVPPGASRDVLVRVTGPTGTDWNYTANCAG